MSRERTPLGPAMRGLIARERGALGPHPSMDEWAAYQEGKLESEEAERLRDHLARCPECAELVMDWMSFAGPVPSEGARPIPKGEVDAAWKALRPQLQFPEGTDASQPVNPGEAPAPVQEIPVRPGLSAVPGGGQPAPPVAVVPRRRLPAWLPQTLAAVFLLASVGLGLQVMKLRGVSAEGQSNLEAGDLIVDLRPVGDVERSGGGAEPAVLFSDRAYQLLLSPAESREFSAYRYTVVEAESPREIVWRGGEREPNEDGSFTLRIPARKLAPSTYRVQLEGVDDGRSTLVDEFEFTVKKR